MYKIVDYEFWNTHGGTSLPRLLCAHLMPIPLNRCGLLYNGIMGQIFQVGVSVWFSHYHCMLLSNILCYKKMQ